MPTVVRKRAGQTDDKLIADFRKKVMNDEVLIELKKKEYYRKPSLARKEKKEERRKLRFKRPY